MDTSKTLSESLIKRMTILRYSLKEAEKYLKETTNEFAFSTGILLLHDATENLFWAINSINSNLFKDEDSFPLKFDKLHTNLKNKIVLDKTSIAELNTIRNSFKHKAILPNIQQAVSIASKVIKDFEATVYKIFNLHLSSVSLSMLIKNDEIRKRVLKVENKIYDDASSHEEYKNALIELGAIYFNYFEERNLSSISTYMEDSRAEQEGKKKKRFRFVEKNVDIISRDLLELGMAPYFYYRFKNLVPSYGLDTEENKVVQKVDTLHWGKENWTKLNSEFCLNWLIEYTLRQQRLYSRNDYNLEFTSRVHIIEPIADFSTKFNSYEPKGSVKLNLKKNVKYLGFFMGYVGDMWQDYNEDDNNENFLILYGSNNRYSAYVPKDLFKIKEDHSIDLPLKIINILNRNLDDAKEYM